MGTCYGKKPEYANPYPPPYSSKKDPRAMKWYYTLAKGPLQVDPRIKPRRITFAADELSDKPRMEDRVNNLTVTADEPPLSLKEVVTRTSLPGMKGHATPQDKVDWLLVHNSVPMTQIDAWVYKHRIPNGLPDWGCILTLLVAYLSEMQVGRLTCDA